MNGWRVGFGVGLLLFVVLPLAMPFRGLFDSAAWHWTADDAARLLHVGLNTLLITAISTALALPCGTCLAVALVRTPIIARNFLLFFLALTLFVPIPVVVGCWQVLLGGARPLATGLVPAIWIHTFVALPWVAFIVGLGLTWVEPELEEAALQCVGPWRVLVLVTLPRARASMLAAALFVILQTAGETNITELVLVPTLADEMRLQFATNQRAALARTLLLFLPALGLMLAGTLLVVRYLEKHLPPVTPPARALRDLAIRPAWTRFLVIAILLGLLIVPISSMIWKLGLAGHPVQWTGATAWHYLQAESRVLGGSLCSSLIVAAMGGIGTALAALLGCWLARDAAWLRWFLFGVTTCAWVLPGPAVGIGLHDLIMALPTGPWKTALYYAPSPAPLIWVQAMRAFPIAVVFLWPVVRAIPREWFEEARLGGAGPVSEFRHIVWPLTLRATAITALAASALCLGEVSASGRVETAGWEHFANTLLIRMHYGVANSLAAMSVMLLTTLVLLGGAVWLVARAMRLRSL